MAKQNVLNIDSILSAFNKLKVIVIGDVMLDTYLWGSVNRISPEAPVPVVSIDKKDERPGGAANVALNIKSLGAKPILCSVIGKDETAKLLLKNLKKNNLSTNGIIVSRRRITSVKTRVLSKSHQMIRYDSEMTSDLLPDDELILIQRFRKIIVKEKPNAVIFEDYNKGTLTPKVIREMINICRAKRIFIAVDPKRKNFFAYKNVDLFKPNLKEIREALHVEIQATEKNILNRISKKLKNRLPHQITLITLSEHGIYYSSQKEQGIIEAYPRDVSDVSGAGDTVIAIATLALVAGMSLKESSLLANIAGGLVCEYAGVVPVTREMLQKEFTHRG